MWQRANYAHDSVQEIALSELVARSGLMYVPNGTGQVYTVPEVWRQYLPAVNDLSRTGTMPARPHAQWGHARHALPDPDKIENAPPKHNPAWGHSHNYYHNQGGWVTFNQL